MTLTNKLRNIGALFNELRIPVYHYWRPIKSAPALIWQEQSESGLQADNKKGEQMVNGVADYYTKTEFDTSVDEIQDVLQEFAVWWQLAAIQYEDETNLIHFTWEWRA